MKKSLMFVSLSLFLLIGFSVFVSAGWFENLVGKITGEVTDTQTCTDSDGGEDYYVKGNTLGLEAPGVWDTWVDDCGTSGDEEGKLVEYVCKDNDYVEKVIYSCSNGCKDGKCEGEVEGNLEGRCEDGFILDEDFCVPKIFDATWDAPLDKALEDSMWIKGNEENGEVKNFLNNEDFVSDVLNVVGDETNQEQIAKKIANWIKSSRPYGCDLSNLDDPCYDHSPVNNENTNLSDFAYIYNYPEGVCFDSAVLTVAALRVAKIPSIVHMESSFHANVLANIDNEWVKIDSTFCSQGQIDLNTCPDASYLKQPAYGVFEVWGPVGDEYCRRDGLCIKSPSIPTSNEVLPSSSLIPLATVTHPRFHQRDLDEKIFTCNGGGWNHNYGMNLPIDAREEIKQEFVNRMNSGLLGKHDFELILDNDLPRIGYIKAKIPENVFFVYNCFIRGTDARAYYYLFAEAGRDYVITADDLIKGEGLSEGEFDYLKQEINKTTSDLGIYPKIQEELNSEGEETSGSDEEISPVCNGCELEDKCYPWGYRVKNKFCSVIDDEFVSQLGEDSQCENHFECGSNLCINNECVSGNLIQKMLNWFKRLFSRGN